jgi:hypothetical protein
VTAKVKIDSEPNPEFKREKARGPAPSAHRASQGFDFGWAVGPDVEHCLLKISANEDFGEKLIEILINNIYSQSIISKAPIRVKGIQP